MKEKNEKKDETGSLLFSRWLDFVFGVSFLCCQQH